MENIDDRLRAINELESDDHDDDNEVPKSKLTHCLDNLIGWCNDVIYCCKNASYMFVSLGFTSVSFTAGALTWYAVTFFGYAVDANAGKVGASQAYGISFIFGVITMLAGVVGVLIGTKGGELLRSRVAYGDPLVCGIGMLVSAPFLFLAIVFVKPALYVSCVLTLSLIHI